MRITVWFLILTLILPLAIAADYTPTGKTDFSVYSDSDLELSGYVYSTVEINISAYPNEAFKCITMVFANESGTFIHVQSNPPHLPPAKLGIINPKTEGDTSPEALGYFPVNNGLANVYFRNDDIIAFNEFLYVIKCNSNSSQLVYEEIFNPNYKEFGKELPSRGAWFAQSENADTIVIVVAVLFILGLFIFARLSK